MEIREKILVIDDDPQIRSTFKAILSGEGYQVDVAETGKEAIEKTEKKWYNLALIDIRLPDINGTQLLTELKEGSPKMRKIMVTGFPTLPNAVEALNKQANAYLTKPVEIPKMLKIIRDQLTLQEEEKTINEYKIGEFIKTRAKEFSERKKADMASIKSKRLRK